MTDELEECLSDECRPIKPKSERCFCSVTKDKIKNEQLWKVVESIGRNYPRLQTRILKYGQFRAKEVVEISRLDSDIPVTESAGPMTVGTIRVLDTGKGALCINGKVHGDEFDVFAGPGTRLLWDNLVINLKALSSEFTYCAGIRRSFFNSCTKNLRFMPVYLKQDIAGDCVRSKRCPLWFEVRHNAKKEERDNALKGEAQCKECSKDFRNARYLDRTTAKRSPGSLKHRASPSSNYPVSFLSPASTLRRYGKLRQKCNNEVAKVRRYQEKLNEALTVTLDKDQSSELAKFITDHVSSEDVEKILNDEKVTGFNEIDPYDHESKRAAILKAFQEDQAKNRSGFRGNRWNMVTFRIALSIFTRSPAAYREIGKWEIFQLPSISSLRKYTTAYLQDEGPYYEYIEEQREKYVKIKEMMLKKGNDLVPNHEGVLILDEVKVAGKVIWNSKNGKISGVAMDKEKYTSLADIFQMLSEKPSRSRDPAQYVLQFLWRDLSSKFDVIGPHYSSASTMTASFTTACLWDAIHAFQMYGFMVSSVVMDGASSNLAMVKLLSGYGKGPYALNGPAEDVHAVSPWFTNPEFPSRRIYLMMCPTHQLKNMINSLWASHKDRPKALQYGRGKKTFGWEQIEGMWIREKERRPGNIRMVKNLVKSYVERDSWTKLNVMPAKIMQQPQVLAELFSHANPDEGNPPEDQEAVMATHAYLKACSQLFEMGFLKSGYEGRIYDVNESTTLQSILSGFDFFKSWMEQLRVDFDDFSLTKATEKRFLAWQTYDLLRLAVYSFKEFCRDYLETYPGYYISPLKLNGSAVETLFSQFKAAAGGKLTSVNYSQAKRTKQLQREVRGDAGGYRDAPLYTQFEPLRKKAKKN